MTSLQKHNISLPQNPPHTLDQDEAFFTLWENGQAKKIRFHDYDQIFSRPGLYEQLFYQRLCCVSPQKSSEVVHKVLEDNHVDIHELRVLDLGAGNGMVGELFDAARMVGVDILPEAKTACERDRPHAYDSYYVTDLSVPKESVFKEFEQWQINCLLCIAALGYGDIPVPAFANAFNLVEKDGWVAFNIKESFLTEDDKSGFSSLVKHLMLTDTLKVHHLERYRHRISIDGRPLFYYLLVGRKHNDIPAATVASCSK